jgi:hypothetical protein
VIETANDICPVDMTSSFMSTMQQQQQHRRASHLAASTSAAGGAHLSPLAVSPLARTPLGRRRRVDRARDTTTTRAASMSTSQPPVGKMRGNIDAWHGADFPRGGGGAAGGGGGAVPGARTVATPTLTPELAFERLLLSGTRSSRLPVAAFFSSELGGIVTDPGLACVHADDHWLHSGHGAAERVPLCEGALYQLAPRLSRLLEGARAVGARVPLGPAALARVVLDTAAASRLMNGAFSSCVFFRLLLRRARKTTTPTKKNSLAFFSSKHPKTKNQTKNTGMVHIWVSRGRGGLSPDPREVAASGRGPALYVSVSAETARRDGEHATPLDRTRGWRAASSPVPPSPPYFGRLLGNARVDMAVAQAEARARGFDTVRRKSFCFEPFCFSSMAAGEDEDGRSARGQTAPETDGRTLPR